MDKEHGKSDEALAPIFIYRNGCGINSQQLQKLRREGYIPVGVDHTDDARLLPIPVPLAQGTLDAIGAAALITVADCSSDWVGKSFAKALAASLVRKKAP